MSCPFYLFLFIYICCYLFKSVLFFSVLLYSNLKYLNICLYIFCVCRTDKKAEISKQNKTTTKKNKNKKCSFTICVTSKRLYNKAGCHYAWLWLFIAPISLIQHMYLHHWHLNQSSSLKQHFYYWSRLSKELHSWGWHEEIMNATE